MNRFLLLAGIALLVFSPTLSQTELWCVNGRFAYSARDAASNLYLCRGIAPDTLLCLRTSGTTRWTTLIDPLLVGLYAGASGVYSVHGGVFYSSNDANDSIIYRDTLGTKRWTYRLGGTVAGIALDAEGNIVVVVRRLLNSQLVKVSPGGLLKFRSDMPVASFRSGEVEQGYIGPFIEPNGRIWILNQAVQFAFSADGLSQKSVGHMYLYKFDNLSGAAMLQKRLFRETVGSSIERATSSSYFESSWPYLDKCKFSNGRLVCIGTGFTQISRSRVIPPGDLNDTYTDWRVLTVDAKGRNRRFRHRGDGLYIDNASDPYNISRYDNDMNAVFDVEMDAAGVVYLAGAIGSGGSVYDGNGLLEQDGLLMRFNAEKTRPEWTVDQSLNPLEGAYVVPGYGVMIRTSATTLAFYDAAGGMGSTTLTVADNIVRVPRELSRDAGEMYLILQRPSGGEYLAKYALAPLSFGPSAFSRGSTEARSYVLHQNYPNPFNPTTTVAFALAEPSLVTMNVYDNLGRLVSTIADGEEMFEGDQEVEFDGSNLASGIYFCRIFALPLIDDGSAGESAGFTAVRKMLLMR